MSGHSKWENIKRKKTSEDQKRGQIFSKLARAISVAAREGGTTNPEFNPRLKMLIQQAKDANMPAANIQRALQKVEKNEENLQSFVLEGYGPGGVAVMIDAISDNRQRTIQELKNLFSRYGGSLSEPGAVAFQFESIGKIITKPLPEEKILEFIQLGINDFIQEENQTIFLVDSASLSSLRKKIEESGAEVVLAQNVMRPKNAIELKDPNIKNQFASFMSDLEQQEDVQNIYVNLAN